MESGPCMKSSKDKPITCKDHVIIDHVTRMTTEQISGEIAKAELITETLYHQPIDKLWS